ncbi:MAG: YdcF family protein [Clostridia bacterium]|nr:YdcF family protein [Clostridia bacterium]
MKKHPILWILLGILAALLLCFGILAAEIARDAKTDETRSADCILVLGAGTWDGEVSPVFRERLSHAVDLYRAGYAPKIILTGGLDPRNTVTDAEAARRWLEAEGIPAEDVFLEEQSRYTHENFVYARRIMEREGMKTALVVSDPLHMKRAMLCARDFGVEGFASPTPTTRYRTARSIVPFMIRETGCLFAYGVWRIVTRPWNR